MNFLTGLLYAICTFILSGKVLAQATEAHSPGGKYGHIENIDGSKLIKTLLNDRYQYNKNLINHGERIQLPKPQSIIGGTLANITFDGRDYVIVNKQVVEVKGIVLSIAALSMLSNKLNLLDHFQQLCADKVNAEYALANRNLQYIKTLDRQYFSALNQFAEITENISHLGKRPNSSITIELALQKMKMPAIDMLTLKNQQVMVAEVATSDRR